MIQNESLKKEYYQALLAKDTTYDGIFFVGVKTTGVFCHASCTAKKPKYENCEFYQDAQAALLAGYRPCKICTPLSYPKEIPDEVKRLIQAVEETPEKRWKERDFSDLGLHSATARRKFKEIYGMTFVQYARSRRMGMAFKTIHSQQSTLLRQQLDMGYQSASGFHDAFSNILGTPSTSKMITLLEANFIETPIGRMLSLTNSNGLYLLEFEDRRGLEKEIEILRQRINARILPGRNSVQNILEKELDLYFKGKLAQFSTPLILLGTEFQKKVWQLLQKIPLGKTSTYKELAEQLGDANKVRAVGNANGKNQISILIPCHRVIQSNLVLLKVIVSIIFDRLTHFISILT